MASSDQENTKRPLSQEDVGSAEGKEETASKKQKLDAGGDPPVQPDSTEIREEGSTEDSVDLEDASEGDSEDLEEGKGKGNGEEFDESHSGDLVEGDDDDSDVDGDGDGSGDESEEELPIIEGQEVELVKGPESNPDGANNVDSGSFLIKGKQGRVLKLAISEVAISEIHNECLTLFDSGRLPHIRASDLEVISDTESELTVHASTVGVSDSYPVRKYSPEEVASLNEAGSLSSHLLAEEKDWCVIEVDGFPALFGSRDLMPED